MFSLKPRKDGFRMSFPKEFIPEEIDEKYTKVLQDAKSFYRRPIDFLNESIRAVDVLGFNNATYAQQQTTKGTQLRGNINRAQKDAFQGASTDVVYRAVANPLSLIDKTLNVTFRHTLGYLNYFLLLETFFYDYSRDTKGLPDLDYSFFVDILNQNGAVYSRIELKHPLIDGIDMLAFDNSQPIAQQETFKCIFKYSNFDYQFIETDSFTDIIDLNDYLDKVAKNYPFFDEGPEYKNPNRIPRFKQSGPSQTIPGGLDYNNDWMSPSSDGQILYEDEGGVLQDIIHHENVNSDKSFQQSTNPSEGNSSGNNSSNNGIFNQETKDSSFISEVATAKMEYSNGLNENEKFLLYPYPKGYGEGPTVNVSFDITETRDKSTTKIGPDGEPTDEYPDRSTSSEWNEEDFRKFSYKS